VYRPDGTLFKHATLSVNHPLKLEDVTFYQASFAPTKRLFLEVNGQPKTVTADVPMGPRQVAIVPVDDKRSFMVFPFYVQQDPGVTEPHVRAFLTEKGDVWGSTPGKMPPNITLFSGEEKQLGGVRIRFIKPEFATGFQIKKAPEEGWVYLSFFIIMLGTVMCFFAQRQVWWAVREIPKCSPEAAPNLVRLPYPPIYEVVWMGRTNKAKVSFAQECQNLHYTLAASLVHPLNRTATSPQQDTTSKTSLELQTFTEPSLASDTVQKAHSA
jgi:cytochrome c biogenesis protein ResB